MNNKTVGGNIANFTVKELHDKTEMAISRLSDARSELAQAEHSIPFYQKELIRRYFKEEAIDDIQEDVGEVLMWEVMYSSIHLLLETLADIDRESKETEN